MLFAMYNLFLPIISCLNKNIKLIINYLLGPLLFIILSWSLYRQIVQQPDLEARWQFIKVSWKQAGFWVVFLLMFVNWGIESYKWMRLVEPLEKFTFLRAYKSVLAGCSITMLTPNRIGEFGGRIMYVSEPNRLKAISLTILGSASQLGITMVMGTLGLFMLRNDLVTQQQFFGPVSWLLNDSLFYTSLFVTVILLLLYFRARLLAMLISRIRLLKGLVKFVEVAGTFSGKQLLRILFLSFLRYIVFILQYMLLLQVMGVEVPYPLSFVLLTVFYMFMVLAPTVGFTELPVRASASGLIFGLFSTNMIGIQATALGIWLINLVLPAILGSLLILGIKIMKEK